MAPRGWSEEAAAAALTPCSATLSFYSGQSSDSGRQRFHVQVRRRQHVRFGLLALLLVRTLARSSRIPADDQKSATEDAWRIHAAVVDWTGKVDSKASFALALESAALGVIVTLTGEGRRLSGLDSYWETRLFWAGVGVLIAALLVVMTVVAPRLRSLRSRSEWRMNYVYFGHLRKWEPQELERALIRGDHLPVVSRNVVIMSKIAWRKHRRLQVSLWLAVLGAATVGLAPIIERLL